MAKKRFSERYSKGVTPSSSRIEDVTGQAQKITEKKEEKQRNRQRDKSRSAVESIKSSLEVELEEIKAKYTPFTNNTTIAMQVDLAKVLQVAHVEFSLSQKELVALGVYRLLKELKEGSTLLKTYM